MACLHRARNASPPAEPAPQGTKAVASPTLEDYQISMYMYGCTSTYSVRRRVQIFVLTQSLRSIITTGAHVCSAIFCPRPTSRNGHHPAASPPAPPTSQRRCVERSRPGLCPAGIHVLALPHLLRPWRVRSACVSSPSSQPRPRTCPRAPALNSVHVCAARVIARHTALARGTAPPPQAGAGVQGVPWASSVPWMILPPPPPPPTTTPAAGAALGAEHPALGAAALITATTTRRSGGSQHRYVTISPYHVATSARALLIGSVGGEGGGTATVSTPCVTTCRRCPRLRCSCGRTQRASTPSLRSRPRRAARGAPAYLRATATAGPTSDGPAAAAVASSRWVCLRSGGMAALRCHREGAATPRAAAADATTRWTRWRSWNGWSRPT
jgi:hypothetical protein